MIRSPIAIAVLAGVVATGGTARVVATYVEDARAAEERPREVEAAERRIARLERSSERLSGVAAELRAHTRAVGQRNAAFLPEIAQQERRIRQLEAELLALG